MNIKIINETLNEYENSFYRKREKFFMEGDNYLTYIKYVDTKNYASSVLGFQIKGLLYILYFALNNFVINALALSTFSYLFLLIVIPLVLTFSTFPFLKKFYYINYLKSVRKNQKERDELLSLIHKEELSNSIISDEIHDLVKLYVSDDEYVSLRKNGITYSNVKLIINIKENKEIERVFLEDKHTVTLNSEYQIINKENHG